MTICYQGFGHFGFDPEQGTCMTIICEKTTLAHKVITDIHLGEKQVNLREHFQLLLPVNQSENLYDI